MGGVPILGRVFWTNSPALTSQLFGSFLLGSAELFQRAGGGSTRTLGRGKHAGDEWTRWWWRRHRRGFTGRW